MECQSYVIMYTYANPIYERFITGARRVSYSGVENGSNKTGYRPSYEEIITTKS